ncbi:hypothetical protein ApDm4_1567 [Acetobacter pomorum]|nr:hypothetical protein ApDm4_1567 [Acetobacter pomorum]
MQGNSQSGRLLTSALLARISVMLRCPFWQPELLRRLL